MPLNSYQHPCPGGYQIQAADMLIGGTLGARVNWGDPARDVVITAGHLVNNLNAAVFQPGAGVPGENQRIGHVAGRSPLRTYPSSREFLGTRAETPGQRITCRYDFAYIEVAGDSAATSYRIPGINDTDEPLAVRDPIEGEPVHWLGNTTGIVLGGHVRDLSYWMTMELDPTNAANRQYLSVQPLTLIEVQGTMPTRGGDSGAAVVAVNDRHIVGVHCLGGTTRKGRPFTMASRVPASPQALAEGSSSAGFDEVLTWIARTKAWVNS
ncbi:hypothetical protein ACGFZP_26585 [Kitasatospora sp. NPDC048239]|uniref:hypothetical protein n=1 Tax=Kitasatospora sp. NPDC048239 TaxID=3364046 RepID=UPI0037198FFA